MNEKSAHCNKQSPVSYAALDFSKNLASMILPAIAKRIADDWEKQYKYRAVLLETFIEKKRFNSSCNRTVICQYMGTTKGRKKKTYIFVTPTFL